MAGDAYTGLRRKKQTPWSVRFGDAFVSRTIAVCGIGTIAAILLVVLVLLGTALPLFRSPQFDAWQTLDVGSQPVAPRYGIDENRLMLWVMRAGGEIEVRSLHNGQLLIRFPLELPEGVTITASALSIDRQHLAVGLSDGSFRVAEIQFETTLLSPLALPAGVKVNEQESIQAVDRTVYQWFDASGVRRTDIKDVVWSAAKSLGAEPVLALDYVPDNSSNLFASSSNSHALAVVGENLVFSQIERKTNRMTKKVTENIENRTVPLLKRSPGGQPLQVMLAGGNQHALVVWSLGTIDRYALDGEQPRWVESQSAAMHASITSAAPLLARQTLLCGLEDGRLQGWMISRPASPAATDSRDGLEGDGYQLSLAHEIQVSDHALTAVSSSRQSHVAVACSEQGDIGLTYLTTNNLLKNEAYPFSGRLISAGFDPSGHTLIALSDQSFAIAELDMGHPEASLKGYFGKVWYEGHDIPKYIWQSSAATAESEIKLSLMPLVFGTLKATFYAMMISVPLAILAAIYTSEFLTSRTRGRVKPAIEMMASLPSVVLGYIAALVIAPYLQEYLMAVLLGLVVVPATFVGAGNLWNLLPVNQLVRLQAYRLPGLLLCLPLAAWISVTLAPVVEAWLFEGSIIGWLAAKDRTQSSAVGGWVLLLTPLIATCVVLLMLGPFSEWNRRYASASTPRGYALATLVRLAVSSMLTLWIAWGLASLFSGIGWDLRGNLFDSYQDRNALLVGFALGFCVIPIIYTISDDALQAVPRHLRSASLGCGATPWQTTMRVVVPSAMSGLFSAVMIGLGRAVGETMVVLCAAGNTPLMDLNVFNGFKTLSAALATELPEAAKGSTHFRTLFLAAVLLFVMTLIANTLAEFVRIRFRKRASQL